MELCPFTIFMTALALQQTGRHAKRTEASGDTRVIERSSTDADEETVLWLQAIVRQCTRP